MSWQDVSYKELHDAARSKSIWLLFGLLAVLSIGYAFIHSYLGEETFVAFVGGIAGLVASVLPVLGILLGYKSIAHERASGSLFLSLSFPLSRRDLIVGKLVSRSIVLLVPTLVALVVAGVVGALRYGTDGVLLYPWFLLATALYGLVFVALAIGLSMATTADRRITLGALGGYLLTVTFWDAFHSLTMLILHRFHVSVLRDLPDWALLFRLVGPAESYHRLVRAGFDVGLAELYMTDGVPFYVDWWMGLLVLVAWSAIPLVLGYRRFESADL